MIKKQRRRRLIKRESIFEEREQSIFCSVNVSRGFSKALNRTFAKFTGEVRVPLHGLLYEGALTRRRLASSV